MYLYELYELIENGENGSVEFKRKFSSAEKIAKEMIAFANTKGGKILFGVDDNKDVVGVESEKGEIELIDIAANFYCDPPVKYTTDIMHIYREDVVVVHIGESSAKPHMLKTDTNNRVSFNETSKGLNGHKVYVRLNDRSILASKETTRLLKNKSTESKPLIFNFGDKEKALVEYLNKNETITLKDFKKLLNISERRASRILVNLVRADIIRQVNLEKEDLYILNS